jgi:hypothetical protein
MTITISGSGTIGGPTTFTDNVTLGTSLLATPSGATPSYLCRAWVNFNGTGTVAIRGSGNVTSITDNGTGDYTVNFTTAMSDANYSGVATCTMTAGLMRTYDDVTPRTASALRLISFNSSSGASADPSVAQVAIFR